MNVEELKSVIRDVPDFPKQGIVFKDITTLLKSPAHFCQCVDYLTSHFQNFDFDFVLGPEARGFVFGAPVSYKLEKGYILVRKAGKLPAKTRKVTYSLEYGEDSLFIHEDAITKGTRIVIIDDLLATGGTVSAMTQLVEDMGGIVAGIGFVVELKFLEGRKKLKGYDIYSLIQYD